MRYSIYPTKDATIYDQYIYKNTGLDEIISELELITNSKNTIVSVLKIKSAELQLI